VTKFCFCEVRLEPYQVQIRYVQGVSSIIRFGEKPTVVPEGAIAVLREGLGEDELRVMQAELVPGDKVRIGVGSFQGIEAVVKEVMPAKERVRLLLDFLGRTTEVELSSHEVVRDGSRPVPL
jgi:transcriptional antiterminator RfaH